MTTRLTICTTCKFAPDQPLDREGRAGGALLADAVENAARHRTDVPRLVRHACLWACAQSCAILIEAPGKTGYLAGKFVPTDDAARAILDWTAAYGESEMGNVRYALWPEGMKGHFIARIPAREGDDR
jgi:predicted metal-binding protein